MILTKHISGINAGRSLAHAIAVQDEASRENGRVAGRILARWRGHGGRLQLHG